MGKLAGEAYVHYEGEIFAPGDELPSALEHLTEGYEAPTEDSEAQGSTSEGDDGAFDVDKATVPQLRAKLDELIAAGVEVEYAADDRKDALQAKVRGALQTP